MALVPCVNNLGLKCTKCGTDKVVYDIVTDHYSFYAHEVLVPAGIPREGICSVSIGKLKNDKNECSCSTMDLMSAGCKCGQMQRERSSG